MVDLFYSMACGVIQLLLMLLPDSPLADWLETAQMEDSAIVTGLGWLNWLVDLQAWLMIMTVWLAAVTVYFGVKYGVSVFGGLRQFTGNIYSVFSQFLGGGGE